MSRHLDSSTTTTNGLYHGPVWKIQLFLLSEICTVILLAGLLCERQFEKILFKYGWEKVSNLGIAYSYTVKKVYSYLLYVDDIKLTGKKQNIDPMWNVLNKEVDSGEPTSFLDHVYLVCTQRQCEISKDIVDNYRTMFEYRISAGATEKITMARKIFEFLRGLVIWKDMPRNVWERYCELTKQDDSTTLQSINSMH